MATIESNTARAILAKVDAAVSDALQAAKEAMFLLYRARSDRGAA